VTTERSAETDTATARRLRRGFLIVAALIIAGTAVELATRQHWTEPVQLIAWAAVLLLVIALGLLHRPTSAKVRAVRIITIVVSVAALFGILEHVLGNYDAAPLDASYGEQWDTLGEPFKWWLALTQTVGPSPALAPGVLILAGLCLWFATVGQPASSDAPE